MGKVFCLTGIYLLGLSSCRNGLTQYTLQRALWELLPIGSVKERVGQLYDIGETLEALLCATRGSIDNLESRAKKCTDDDLLPNFSLRLTAQTLPDDILCCILQAGLLHDAISFSQVCRKFRRVALELPTLWTYIDDSMTLPKIKAYLSRSQDAPLFVSYQLEPCKYTLQSAQSFFITVFKHAHRIESMSISIPGNGDDLSAWMNRDESSNLALPMLKYLTLNEPYGLSDSVNFQDNSEQGYQFIARWTVPNLLSLHTSNMLSCPLFERRKFTSLELVFGGYEEDTLSLATEELLDILRSNPQLQNLSLTFSDTLFDSCAGPPVLMSNVESLTIGWLSAEPGDSLSQDELDLTLDEIGTIRELSHHLVFPNVVTIKLDLEVKVWRHVPQVLQLLLDGQSTFESVASFQLKLRSWFHTNSTCFLDSIFHKFPNLINLSIDAVDSGHDRLWKAYANLGPLTPKLDSVKMRLNGAFSSATITPLLDSTDVRKLEIVHHPQIHRPAFDKYNNKVNVVWKEEISTDH